MKAYRKPQVRVACDFCELEGFRDTVNLEAAAGTWLRCLAYSTSQELGGVVVGGWVRRTFADRLHRIDELVRVDLLRELESGDYLLSADGHLEAPRPGRKRARLKGSRKAVGS